MASHGVNTRRVYAFDKALYTGEPLLPMAELRKLGRRIWTKHSPWKARCPEIVAGKGMRFHDGSYISYCEGRNRIVLTRQDRNRVILIHEMSHALTHWRHGIGFQNKYAELLSLWMRSTSTRANHG